MASDFETFCGGTFWNSSLTWGNVEWPEFSECFQLTLIVWVPCAFLWLTLPLNIAYMYTHRGVPITQSALSAAKMVTGAVLSMLCFSEMITVNRGDYTPAALYVTPAIKTVTMGLTIALFYLERRWGFITSGIQFVFWFLLLLFNIVPFYTRIFYVEDDVFHASATIRQMIVFYIQFALILIQFVLQFKAEKLPKEIVDGTAKAPCPEILASFFSRVTFWWSNSLVIAGYKKPLEETDLWDSNPRDKCSTIVPILEAAWSKEMDRVKKEQDSNSFVSKVNYKSKTLQISAQRPNKTPSLFRVTVLLYGPTVLKAISFKIASDILLFAKAYILLLLINYTEDKAIQEWKGYVYVVAMLLCNFIQSIFLNQNFYVGLTLGMRIKAAFITAIYRKSLRMNSESRKQYTVGEIVNLMSVDGTRLMEMTGYIWMLISCPLQIALSMLFLYLTLGPSMFAGLGLLVAIMPINLIIAAYVKKFQTKQMRMKDSRIKLMSEVLSGIKALKMYAWEKMFQIKVNSWRKKEMAFLKKLYYMNEFGNVLWTTAPYFVSLVTYVTYVFVSESHHLDASKAFFSLVLFNIMRFPINFMPLLVSHIIQAQVSMKRIGHFLRLEDFVKHDDDNVKRIDKFGTAVTIKNGTFSWTKTDEPTLHDINIDVPHGQLIAVVGQVGSGKSSLISAILKEMEKMSGDITIAGRIAYVPQEAWIQNMTLKDNVIFTSKYKMGEYKKVIDSCALLPDLSVLPDGDLTEIGEKGINLSGGQKQRVSLARAVYSDADIFLLDDPLSAVDAHVAKHLFDNVIGNDGLLRDKTRVLVTHNVHSLPLVDTVVVMDSGRITKMGHYEELMKNDEEFTTFIHKYLTADAHDGDSEEMEDAADTATQQDISAISGSETKSIFDKNPDLAVRRESLPKSVVKTDASITHKLVLEEKSETRQVSYRVYLAYATAVGPAFAVIIFISFAAVHVCQTLANVWLSKWTEDPVLKAAAVTNFGVFHPRNYYYIAIFGGLGAAQAVFGFFYSLLYSLRKAEAATKLHDLMLTNVLRSPMSFFETTPVGRIINRFSQDIDRIDMILPETLGQFANVLFSVLSAIVVIAATTPLFLVALVPVVIFYYFIQRFYISTSRQLKRLESTTQSLIYSHFTETIAGASSIRAYDVVDHFTATSDRRVDRNIVHTFAGFVSNRWLAFRLDLISNILVVAAILFSVIGRDNLTGGLVGLSVVYAMQLTDPLNWMVRMMSALETNIVSVERVKEYSEMPTEAAWDIPDHVPSLDWPESGTIEFINYSMRYRPDLDVVLEKISCRIHGGEKVGVVGRTGAGKSSFTLALLRIVEAAHGSITIDGRSIADMGLYNVRSRLTVLPQDPVLFSGTLRMNVDPFELYTDDEIWRVLDTVSMKSFVTTLPDLLDHECGEGGGNLSVGQKQLVCLARALLKKTKIIILDEATAAVDIETDDVIQQTIRSEFSDCTVVTIAHRLNTIMDCDRVMVLDAGSIAEFDSPSELLKNETTIFYGLAKDAGLL